MKSVKKSKKNYPTNKIDKSKNPAFRYERKIYQHIEGFCNRGNRVDLERKNYVKNIFGAKEKKSSTPVAKKKKKSIESLNKTQKIKLSQSPLEEKNKRKSKIKSSRNQDNEETLK